MKVEDFPKEFPTDPQEIFDRVAKHLLTQNEKCIARVLKKDNNAVTVCAYRSYRENNILACAAGCLIPERKYDPSMEGSIFLSIAIHHFPDISDNLITFISELQIIHDRHEVDNWRYLLKAFATKHNLDSSVLNNF